MYLPNKSSKIWQMYFVRNKRGGSESGAMGLQVYGKYINYLGEFCQL